MTNYRTAALIVFVLAGIIAYREYEHIRERDAAYHAGQASQADTLRALSATTAIIRAREVDREAVLVGLLRDNDALKAEISTSRPKSIVGAAVSLVARPDSGEGNLIPVAPDSTHEQIGFVPELPDVGRADSTFMFHVRSGRHDVTGQVIVPRSISMRIQDDPIRLKFLATQDRYRVWSVAVDTQDSLLRVESIEAQFIDRKPGWIERQKFWIGSVLGTVITFTITH